MYVPSLPTQLREKVLDEVRVLHRTRHCSRIVRLLALCMSDDDTPPSMVMEFMKGGSLHSHVKRREGFLRWGRKGKRIALDVAEGLLYLHTRRPIVVHRDLRCCNILLTAGLRAKIADLGSAKDQERTALPSLSVLFNQWAAFPPESVLTALAPGNVRSYKWDVWQARKPSRAAAAARCPLLPSPAFLPSSRRSATNSSPLDLLPLHCPAQMGAVLVEILTLEVWSNEFAYDPQVRFLFRFEERFRVTTTAAAARRLVAAGIDETFKPARLCLLLRFTRRSYLGCCSRSSSQGGRRWPSALSRCTACRCVSQHPMRQHKRTLL